MLGGLLLAALPMGCQTPPQRNPDAIDHGKMSQMMSEWRVANQQIALSQGEREFDVPFGDVFSAAVTGISGAGVGVTAMERESGYIAAEGPAPLPESQMREISKRQCDVSRKRAGGQWTPVAGNFKINVTLIVEKITETRSRLRMRVSTASIQAAPGVPVYNELFPEMHSAILASLWLNMERQSFLNKALQ